MAQDPNKARELGYYYALAQVGFEMAAPVGLGWWVDDRFGFFPWLTVIGTMLGLALGVTHLLLMVARHDRDQPPRDKGS